MYSKISELGFSSDESLLVEKNIFERNEPVFRHSEQISRAFIRTLSSAKIDSKSVLNLLVNASAARSLEFFQSVDILLRRGCVPASKAVCRSQLETVYKCVALCNGSVSPEEYINQSKLSRLQKLKGVQRYQQKYPGSNAIPELQKEIQKLHEETKSIKQIKPHHWATQAKMEDFHNNYYQGLSDDVHGNVETMDHYFDQNDNYNFCFFPSEADIDLVAFASQKSIINTVANYAEFNNSNLHSFLENANEVTESIFVESQES